MEGEAEALWPIIIVRQLNKEEERPILATLLNFKDFLYKWKICDKMVNRYRC